MKFQVFVLLFILLNVSFQIQDQSNQYGDCEENCIDCDYLRVCLKCDQGFTLIKNKCVSQCGNNFYWDALQNSCQSCDKTCETCDGPFSSNCKSCKGDLILNIMNTTYSDSRECVETCPQGKYSNGYTCSVCHSSCKTCHGDFKDQCSSCENDLVLYEHQCVETCPQGYVLGAHHICQNTQLTDAEKIQKQRNNQKSQKHHKKQENKKHQKKNQKKLKKNQRKHKKHSK